MNSSPIYYAQTMPGIEQIAWLEIRNHFPGAKFQEYLFVKEKNGIVIWQFDGNPDRLLELRTIEDVFVLVDSTTKLSRDWRDLRLIAKRISESSLTHAVRAKIGARHTATYRVISRKVGNHQYRRMDFEQAVVKGIEQKYGDKWTLVDDDAEIEIWANILGSRLLCGLRLSDRSMRHRWYKSINLPASLRPSVAAAMVFLTEPNSDDVFLEAMCGSGTLMAERILAGRYDVVIGGEISPNYVHAAAENLSALKSPFSICRWDACKMPLASSSIDKAAVNLPFGKQIGSRKELERLYPRFFAELERVLKPGGRATILSSEYDLVKQALRPRKNLKIERGYSIAVLGQWGRIYIIKRLAQ